MEKWGNIMITLIYAALILALLGISVAMSLAFLEKMTIVLKQIAIDLIEIYARASQAKFDTIKRHAELDYWIDKGQAELHAQRQKLLSGGEQ